MSQATMPRQNVPGNDAAMSFFARCVLGFGMICFLEAKLASSKQSMPGPSSTRSGQSDLPKGAHISTRQGKTALDVGFFICHILEALTPNAQRSKDNPLPASSRLESANAPLAAPGRAKQ